MKNYFENLEESATAIHAGNVAKGFWTPPQSLAMSVALAISELYEALEAARSGRATADYQTFSHNIAAATALVKGSENKVVVAGMQVRADHFSHSFETWIKDTVADELADFVIRCLDLAKGHKFYFYALQHYFDLSQPDNTNSSYFTEAGLEDIILDINNEMLTGFTRVPLKEHEPSIAKALSLCYYYCQAHNINLNWHIHYKLLYNSTRPAKHGKDF